MALRARAALLCVLALAGHASGSPHPLIRGAPWHPRRFERQGETPRVEGVEATPARQSLDAGRDGRCGLHLFRHVSKTGGTTVRFMFDKQVAMGEWEFPLVYGFKRDDWDRVVGKFRDAAARFTAGTGPGPRVLVEVRGNWPERWCAESFGDVLKDVQAIRADFPECRVTSSILVREPLKQYLSFYNYYIKREQVSRADEYGTTVADWARSVRDMQVREVLGEKCTPQMREPVLDKATGERRPVPQECEITEDEFRSYRDLLRSFDVVGTTAQFNSFAVRLAHAAGIRYPNYKHSNAGAGSRDRGALSEADAEALDDATKYDRRAFDEAVALAKAQEQAWPEFGEQLRAFEQATVTRGEHTFHGGAPPESLYRFVDADNARAALGREGPEDPPAWWLFEGGGRQAIAYINFKSVVLVERDGALKRGLRCVRGCNLDASN